MSPDSNASLSVPYLNLTPLSPAGALTENEDRNQTGDDSSRKSLEHFRAKLKQLRPLSLGSIVGSKGSSSSDVPSPLSGLSLTAAASSASTNASSTSNSVKRASGSWNQPGHPNPSALNVSAQVSLGSSWRLFSFNTGEDSPIKPNFCADVIKYYPTFN